MQKNPELLAPVGSWESLLAAVNNGADAVYCGGIMFSARANANNFDNDEMKKAVEFCHLRGVKIYVTVNILVADHEIEQAIDYLKFLYETGVDAIIIQDIGLARLSKKLLPDLELHASTQMTVHNLSGLNLLMEDGFKRIVLAREMNLKEISEIKEKSGANLEVFIHGALCVCYSGQCLMSSLIGGRSGNRGRCAQPCRLEYTLVDREGNALADSSQVGKHLLSPRDLNMLQYVPDLIDAGIDSFKIEGRMKRPEYVATVIRVYRQVIDRYLANPDTFLVKEEEEKALLQIFNRDFTSAYFFGNQGRDMMSYKRPNNRGIKIGRVSAINEEEKKVEISLEEPLRLGDGLEAWVTQGGRQGTVVRQIIKNGNSVEQAETTDKVWVELPGRIRPGDRVFKTHDANLIEAATISYTSAKSGKKTPLDCTVEGSVGEPLIITFIHPNGFKGEAKTNFIAEVAQKRPLTVETVLKQVERLGNTPFEIGQFNLKLQGEIMVPVSEINEARRQAIESLEKQLISSNKPKSLDYSTYMQNKKQALDRQPLSNISGKIKLSVTVGDIESLERAVNSGADAVYLTADLFKSKNSYKKQDVEWAYNLCHGKGVEFIYQTPRIAQKGEFDSAIKSIEGYLKEKMGILCTNLGFLKEYMDKEYKVMADFTMNIFNRQSLLWLKEHGVARATISPEMTLEQISNITASAPLEVEFMVHGALPMMITEYCAPGSILGGKCNTVNCNQPCQSGVFGLKDRLDMIFPLEVDSFCHMHVFNPKELCLIEDIGNLANAGVRYLRIEGKKENADYLGTVVDIYRKEIDRYLRDPKNFRGNHELKEKLTLMSPSGTTKGHLYRGVI